MKALILYVGLVVVGAVLSALLGIYLEKAISSTVSLVVFLSLFFANFVISWIIVIYIMDGTSGSRKRNARASPSRKPHSTLIFDSRIARP